jgi:hypothetical protein
MHRAAQALRSRGFTAACFGAQVFALLAGHAEAIARLQAVLRRDDRDLSILGAAAGSGVADMALVPSF